jgi:beta-aspartyl-dipeptidase (metallo-type)
MQAGLVHIHVGPGASGLQALRDAVACSDIPLSQFHPTHMDRSEGLIDQGAQWLLDGGSLDFTGETAVRILLTTCPIAF